MTFTVVGRIGQDRMPLPIVHALGIVLWPMGRVAQAALSYWDTPSGRWRVAPGCYRVMLGHSSRNIVRQIIMPFAGGSCRRTVAVLVGGR